MPITNQPTLKFPWYQAVHASKERLESQIMYYQTHLNTLEVGDTIIKITELKYMMGHRILHDFYYDLIKAIRHSIRINRQKSHKEIEACIKDLKTNWETLIPHAITMPSIQDAEHTKYPDYMLYRLTPPIFDGLRIIIENIKITHTLQQIKWVKSQFSTYNLDIMRKLAIEQRYSTSPIDNYQVLSGASWMAEVNIIVNEISDNLQIWFERIHDHSHNFTKIVNHYDNNMLLD